MPGMRSLLFAARVAAAAGLPFPFTWDTAGSRLYSFCSNTSGALSPTAVAALSRSKAMIHGMEVGALLHPVWQNSELKVNLAAKQLRAVAPEQLQLYTVQIDFARSVYASGAWFNAHPECTLHDAHGHQVVNNSTKLNPGHCDNTNVSIPGSEFPFGVCVTYGFDSECGRKQWVKSITDACELYDLDGVFIDGFQGCTPAEGCNRLLSKTDDATKTAWLQGLNESLWALYQNFTGSGEGGSRNKNKAKKKKKIICNRTGSTWNCDTTTRTCYCSASNDERWGGGPQAVAALQSYAAETPGKSVIIHVPHTAVGGAIFNSSLASFLLGSADGDGIGLGFGYDCEEGGWLKWSPDLDKPLGAPLGPATNHSHIWRRRFASGAQAYMNATPPSRGAQIATCIRWADESATERNNGCEQLQRLLDNEDGKDRERHKTNPRAQSPRRHVGVWDSPPLFVPVCSGLAAGNLDPAAEEGRAFSCEGMNPPKSSGGAGFDERRDHHHVVDGPVVGNGNLGVVVGGGAQGWLDFYTATNSFWAMDNGNFTHGHPFRNRLALPATMQIAITRLGLPTQFDGGYYAAEVDFDAAVATVNLTSKTSGAVVSVSLFASPLAPTVWTSVRLLGSSSPVEVVWNTSVSDHFYHSDSNINITFPVEADAMCGPNGEPAVSRASDFKGADASVEATILHRVMLVGKSAGGRAPAKLPACTTVGGGKGDSPPGRRSAQISFTLPSDGSPVSVATIVRTSRDPTCVQLPSLKQQQPLCGLSNDTHTASAAIAAALDKYGITVGDAAADHAAHWVEFYNASSVSLPDAPETELFWYASQYILNSAVPHEGQEQTPPGLYGPFGSIDNPSWHGDFTIDYSKWRKSAVRWVVLAVASESSHL